MTGVARGVKKPRPKKRRAKTFKKLEKTICVEGRRVGRDGRIGIVV